MKKFLKIAATALAAGSAAIIAGCATGGMGCTGCSSCNGNNKTVSLTSANWYTGTSYRGIQPSFIENDEHFSKEALHYDVTFEAGSNSRYSVDYKDGSFTTEFYATTYDWANTAIPEAYRATGTEIVYCYKTSLTVSVKYAMKSGDKQESEWFNDSIINESYFRATGKNLQPLYSKQVIKSTSPSGLAPANVEAAYRKIDSTYESFYNNKCTKVYTQSTEDGKTSTKELSIKKLKHSFFDNSMLYIAVRSMTLSSSHSIVLYSAAMGGISDYTVTPASRELTVAERTKLTNVLEAKQLYRRTTDSEGIEYSCADISYAGGNLIGTSQSVWFAKVTDPDNNISRATMLKLSVPLSFNLGTLNFTLDEVTSTLWNE